jgi:excisionase family DNA binding protein
MQGNVTTSANLLLTVKEAAARVKTSTATVYALCESGRLAYARISTHVIRIAAADLEAYVRGRRLEGKATRRAAPSR